MSFVDSSFYLMACFFFPDMQFHLLEFIFTFTFSHLADAFIQSDLQMRTMEAIKINKRAMIDVVL